MYIERHSIKIQLDMQVFFSKVGVNIQKLTHLACLLGDNSRPSQGEYFVYRSLPSEASSRNGEVKFSTDFQY